MAMLEVKDLQVYYGVIQAIKGISFEVNQGEIVTLIGANGAGKTTTMQSIMGLVPIKSGTVTYEGQVINKVPCHKIVKLGMTQVPEGRRIFQELTVYQNLLMGAFTEKDKKKIKNDIEEIYARFPRLGERKNQIAGTLSGGEQQMLAMG
ncbi:MAG: ABC transporter ATP-binding protein, partial [Acutalibacteraceae bacterium]